MQPRPISVVNNNQPTTGQSQETINALVQSKLDSIETKLDGIVDTLKDGVVHKDIYLIDKKAFEERIISIEKKSNLWKFLSPTFAAGFGVLITFLITEYFKKNV